MAETGVSRATTASSRAIPPELAELTDWDTLVTQLGSIAELTPNELVTCTQGLRFLQAELGDDFLRGVLRDNHPLRWTLANQVGWTRLWLAWLATALKYLRGASGLDAVTAKISDARKYAEAVSLVETGWRFARAGFAVSFEPDALVEGVRKKPDLLVVDAASGRQIYLEVTRQLVSFTQDKAWKTFMRLTSELMRHPVDTLYAGRLLKSLSAKHLDEVARTLRDFMATFRPNQGFSELNVPGVLSIGLASREGEVALREWAAKLGVEPGQFEGPPDETNELHRLALKVRKEEKQLPRTHPGLVIIGTSALPTAREHVAWIANILEESLHDYPQLLGVVLHGTYMGSSEELVLDMAPHFFLQYGGVPFEVSQQMFIANRYCDRRVDEGVAGRIRAALATKCVPDPAVLAA